MENKIYLKKIIESKDNGKVKVLTGMRGIGKSTLLTRWKAWLIDQGVLSQQVILLSLDETQYDEIQDDQQLYQTVFERIQGLPRAYLLLDEVHRIPGWEKAVNAILKADSADICIAGSHSSILSEEFCELMEGRYQEISVYPRTFGDYLEMFPDIEEEDREFVFPGYLKFGGLPVAMALADKASLLPVMLQGIYNTALMRDVIQRYAVRDPDLMDCIARFLASSVGKPITAKRLNDYLTSVGRKTTGYTMDNYLQMLTESNLFYRARRYDIKAKSHLNGSEKFYLSDIGIGNMLRNYQALEDGPMLENVVCVELLRRGYQVSAGKIGSMTVTFVAENENGRLYYQVVPSLQDEHFRKKALRPLRSIPDQYGKVILSMDHLNVRDFDGIRNLNIVDFLMGE